MLSHHNIESKDGTLVIDSRLVAQELGIGHSDWMSNVVKKYQDQIESEFGALRFENAPRSDGNKGGSQPRFIWLTEDQAVTLAVLSKNTSEVVSFKIRLVKAFLTAKRLLEGGRTEGVITKDDNTDPLDLIIRIQGLNDKSNVDIQKGGKVIQINFGKENDDSTSYAAAKLDYMIAEIRNLQSQDRFGAAKEEARHLIVSNPLLLAYWQAQGWDI